jgi:hypothetical protein
MEDESSVGFFYFHVCNFLGSFTLQGGAGGGSGGARLFY